MIKVKIKMHGQEYKEIKVTGHANSAEYGKDLVCAGVSTTIVGTYNTLEKFNELNHGEFIVQEGFAHFIINQPTRENQLILETMVTTLETIEFSYGKFIHIDKQEA